MANALTKIPSRIAEAFKKMTKGQKVRLIVLIVIIIAILIIVSVVLNQKNYVVVFAGNAADAGEVMTALDDLGVEYQAQGTGTILVEESVAASVKMELAAQGYPSNGFNNEIFQNAAGLGTTDMEKRKYWQLQQQENLRQTILLMDKVDDAVVNLDLGENSSYVLSSDETKPTASVTLTLKNSQRLSDSEAQTIAEMVSGAISGMAAEDVRIVDTQMNVYSTNGDDVVGSVDTQLGLQDAVRQQMQTQVTNLLAAVVGEANVRATVNVKLNFDSKKSESVEFAPPVEGSSEGLEVSMKELVEQIANDSTGAVAGIDANGTASEYLNALDENADNSKYYQVSREANYELNQTKTQIDEAKGKIEELSVSVIINSDAVDDYSEEFKQLVATAIGVDPERITVMPLPFAQVDDTAAQDALNEQQSMLASMQSAETTRLMIILATVLVVMIFIFMIFRTFKKKPEPVLAEGGFEYIADEEIIPGQVNVSQPSFDEIKLEDFEKTDNKLSILEDYIGMNPESVANLLRNWLNED